MKLLWLCLLAAIVACSAQQSAPPDRTIDDLRAAGLDPQPAGTLQQPFFKPPAQVFRVEGGDLQLYRFPSADDAAAAAATVAPGGGSVGTSSMAWMAPPHFFRSGSVIAIYIGTSAKALAALQRVFGPQFAGS